jgi:surface polysaccharide O-acyltransferase-like enzyme
METKSIKIQWLDTLRAMATFGVIIIHVATPALKMNFNKNIEYWWISNIVDSAVRFAVPVFLMLTGATMLNRNYQLGDFYKKRFTRVFVPFLFWMLVYWVFRWIVLKPAQQPHEISGILNWAIDLFLKEGISKHFWYFYMILVVYLFVPFLGRGLRKLENSTVLIILFGWVLANFWLRNTPMNMYGWSTDIVGGKFLGWMLHAGYLVVGYYLVNLPPFDRKRRWLSLVVFIGSVVSCSVFTYIFSGHTHKLDLSLYGYLKINTIIQSVAVFLMVKDFELTNKPFLWIQNQICSYSYGIYLAHVMVIGTFFNWGFYWKIAHPIISLPLVSVATLVTCYMIVFVLRKIPGGKYLVG